MKVRRFVLLAAVAAVAAVPVTAEAGSARDRATGGGQVLLDPGNPPTGGALDTVAFTAQQEHGATDSAADGQVQVNRRSGGADAVKFHGVVDCLIVNGNKAYISGADRDGVPFELFVVDGGSGDLERGSDQSILWYGPETGDNSPDQQVVGNFTPPQEDEFCGIEEDPNSKRTVTVARGNNQVYDAP
jgi:hypothetical protein